ncbi:MAG TPA: flagellar basal body-associated FliL family protein [Hyphomonadaceae bacterium]|nr:flagellar basal body-associated FliL family protein [Hyphomonadaceae bacterium]
MAKKDKAKKGEKPEETEVENPAAEGGEGAPPAKKKLAGKTLVLFIILPAVLVLGGGGAAAFMLLGSKPAEAAETHGEAGGHAEKKPEKKPAKKDDHGGGGGSHGAAADAGAATAEEQEMGRLLECEEGNPCYYAMPDLIVNLAAVDGQREQSLKLDLVLEASDPANFDAVPAAMPRLKDQLNSFLRELRVEDLNGSAGTYRLRRELMKRFNVVMAPAKVDAVLIEGMLIQ